MALSATLPTKPFAGETVIVDVFPVVAPAFKVTGVPLRVNAGAAAVMTYAAEMIALGESPGAAANAWMVSEALTGRGNPATYTELDVVGTPVVE
jgi:hypothetical protein